MPDFSDPPRLDAALHALRRSVTAAALPPAAAAVRARADHRQRVRRTAAALAVAAAVIALALGGGNLLRLAAGPPAPPAGTPTPSPVSPVPSPRPAPLAVEPVDDPIATIDWTTTTIDVPPRDGCPSGAVAFVAREDFPVVPDESVGWAFAPLLGPATGFPAIGLEATDPAAVADLTGDGRAEAVFAATCHPDADGGGYGETLMVVARDGSGALSVREWITVPAGHQGVWAADGTLFIQPSVVSDETIALGPVRAYRWDSGGFVDSGPAEQYPAVLPAGGATGAPLRPGVIAAQLGCPDAELRFGRPGPPSAAVTDAYGGSDFLGASTAAAGGATYELLVARSQHLADLDRTGVRLLLAALACHRADGSVGHGLAVFEPAGGGWHGISVLQPEPATLTGERYTLDGWRVGSDLVEVAWTLHPAPDCGECDTMQVESMHRWTGTTLESVSDNEEFRVTCVTYCQESR